MHESLPNTIDYIEMPSLNLAETKRFFSGLFGWTFQDYGPDYAAFDDGRMAGGFFTSEKTSNVDSGAPLIVFYDRAPDKIEKRVIELGGKITREIFEFPGGRRFHFREPGAASLRFGRTGSAKRRNRGPQLLTRRLLLIIGGANVSARFRFSCKKLDLPKLSIRS